MSTRFHCSVSVVHMSASFFLRSPPPIILRSRQNVTGNLIPPPHPTSFTSFDFNEKFSCSRQNASDRKITRPVTKRHTRPPFFPFVNWSSSSQLTRHASFFCCCCLCCCCNSVQSGRFRPAESRRWRVARSMIRLANKDITITWSLLGAF